MHRRQFLRNTALTAGLLSFSTKNLLAGILDDPTFKIKMLRNDIGIFTEQGGTIGFYLSKEGMVVVDSEFPDPAKHLIAELKKQSEQPFKLLVNTHHHMDHTAGNISFKGLAQHVLAHANSKANQEMVAKQRKVEDQQLYPDQTYATTWCGKTGNENMCLSYFGPAHTNGDSFVHFENANIVHTGDLVFNRRHPFVDRTAGANINSWIEVLDKGIKKYDKKTIFIFGHSGNGYEVTGSVDDVKAFRDYLGKVLQFTESEIQAGKTKEEFLKATEIPGAPQWKGDGIERPLTAAYEELTTK